MWVPDPKTHGRFLNLAEFSDLRVSSNYAGRQHCFSITGTHGGIKETIWQPDRGIESAEQGKLCLNELIRLLNCMNFGRYGDLSTRIKDSDEQTRNQS